MRNDVGKKKKLFAEKKLGTKKHTFSLEIKYKIDAFPNKIKIKRLKLIFVVVVKFLNPT